MSCGGGPKGIFPCTSIILDETQFDCSIDPTSHSIFESEVGNRQHGPINRGNGRRNKHNGENDAESNCSADKNLSASSNGRMVIRFTNSRAVRFAEELSTI